MYRPRGISTTLLPSARSASRWFCSWSPPRRRRISSSGSSRTGASRRRCATARSSSVRCSQARKPVRSVALRTRVPSIRIMGGASVSPATAACPRGRRTVSPPAGWRGRPSPGRTSAVARRGHRRDLRVRRRAGHGRPSRRRRPSTTAVTIAAVTGSVTYQRCTASAAPTTRSAALTRHPHAFEHPDGDAGRRAGRRPAPQPRSSPSASPSASSSSW